MGLDVTNGTNGYVVANALNENISVPLAPKIASLTGTNYSESLRVYVPVNKVTAKLTTELVGPNSPGYLSSRSQNN